MAWRPFGDNPLPKPIIIANGTPGKSLETIGLERKAETKWPPFLEFKESLLSVI